MNSPRNQRFAVIAALAAAVLLTVPVSEADARAKTSSSSSSGISGSRGTRTQDAPAPTQTAPNTIAPSTAAPGAAATRPAATQNQPAAPSGGFFSRGGFGGMLMGGLLGAGIAGLLFGGGFLDGLGSLAGMLGFLLQVAVIGFLVMLAVRFFKNRNRPAYAGAEHLSRDAGPGLGGRMGGLGGLAGGLGGGSGGARPQPATREAADEIGIGPDDYQAFERLLAAVQDAYSREDKPALRRLATTEMADLLAEDFAAAAARGVVNRVSDVKLAQGDLAEAWREPDAEYATVAMRFSLVDVTVERATGRVVEGDPAHPVEATEIWTFRRAPGGEWILSAIQPAE